LQRKRSFRRSWGGAAGSAARAAVTATTSAAKPSPAQRHCPARVRPNSKIDHNASRSRREWHATPGFLPEIYAVNEKDAHRAILPRQTGAIGIDLLAV